MWPFDTCCGEEFDSETKTPIKTNAMLFTFKSRWIGIFNNSAESKGKIAQLCDRSLLATQRFSEEVLGNQKTSLSLFCLDFNQIINLGNPEKDRGLLVLKFKIENLEKDDLVKILLPIFLIMSNVLTEFSDQDRSNVVLEKLQEFYCGDVAGEIFEKTKELHENIDQVKKIFIRDRANCIHLVEVMADVIRESAENSGKGNVKVEHFKSKRFAETLSDKKVLISRTPSPNPIPQPPTTGQFYPKLSSVNSRS